MKILNDLNTSNEKSHREDMLMTGTLLETLRLKQIKFMDSANSDLILAGVPRPLERNLNGKIDWKQLSEANKVELLKTV